MQKFFFEITIHILEAGLHHHDGSVYPLLEIFPPFSEISRQVFVVIKILELRGLLINV